MKQGAMFHKADLQVHTPRDRRWYGEGAVSHDERVAWAADFIAGCREKNLDIIGITDHHDMCLAKYVQIAAQDEKFEPDGENVPCPGSQNPIVFPGMELTLGVPCQVLLLLDPRCDEDDHALVVNCVCGDTEPELSENGPEVRQLRFDTISKLDKCLQDSAVNGKYIILPNVSDSGDRG
jgi:type III restriction enzyme